MSGDSRLFRHAPWPGGVPLFEAKLFNQFDHRFATYEGATREQLNVNILPRLSCAQKADFSSRVRPRYWVDRREVEARIGDRWAFGWLLAFRDVTNASNERTVIFSVLPRAGVGHNAPVVLPSGNAGWASAVLLANLNSLVLDFVARQKVGGTHLTFGIVRQLPLLPPQAYCDADLDFIVPRVIELVYTSSDLQAFAQDYGYAGPPFRWDDDRRSALRADLDAYYAALYGLTRDELRYILDPQDVYGPGFPSETFRVLKERELREYGEYRTRRLVLEAWDRLGLEPRNRDGRYTVDPPPSSANGSPQHGLQENGGKYQVDPRRSRVVVSGSRPGASRRARATRSAATSVDGGWGKMQPSLPGMPGPIQPSFADINHDDGTV